MKHSGEERRSQLIEVALRLFSERGFDGVSTYAIAQAAGVTEGLIFHYFRTKQALFRSVIEAHGFQPFHHLTLATLLDKTPDDGLNLALNSFLEVLWKNRAFVRLTISSALTDQEQADDKTPLGAEPRKRLSLLLQAYEMNGKIRQGVAESASSVISAAVTGFLFSSMRDEPVDWNSARSGFVSDLVTTVVDGIALKSA